MSSPVAIIFGAGGNTGGAITKQFRSKGWSVVTVSRSAAKDVIAEHTSLHLQADFTDPSSVEKAYQEAEQKFGIPNLVVYNAAAVAIVQEPSKAFADLSISKFADDLTVNTTSVYAAIKAAVDGFQRLPASAPKTFIYTSNMETGIIVPEVLTLGAGKNATLYLIEAAAALYGDLAHFYAGDERDIEGNSTMNKIDGEAHAVAYWELANGKEQGPINYTFVKDKGYVKFDVDRAQRPVEHVGSLLQKAAKAYEARGGK